MKVKSLCESCKTHQNGNFNIEEKNGLVIKIFTCSKCGNITINAGPLSSFDKTRCIHVENKGRLCVEGIQDGVPIVAARESEGNYWVIPSDYNPAISAKAVVQHLLVPGATLDPKVLESLDIKMLLLQILSLLTSKGTYENNDSNSYASIPPFS